MVLVDYVSLDTMVLTTMISHNLLYQYVNNPYQQLTNHYHYVQNPTIIGGGT